MPLNAELRANYAAFAQRWKRTQSAVVASLAQHQPDPFFESYKRVLSLQAWRSELLEEQLAAGALPFFIEAQNDALISHILAQTGMWRPALQALRSTIENCLLALYYRDHPVELRLWEQQRLTFSELNKYFAAHPDKPRVASVVGLEQVVSEYATLSRAVHASAQSFRMAAGDDVRFFISDQASLGAWRTRERSTLGALNLLLLWFFREQLIGARLPNLRRILAYSISGAQRAEIRRHLQITLPNPT